MTFVRTAGPGESNPTDADADDLAVALAALTAKDAEDARLLAYLAELEATLPTDD